MIFWSKTIYSDTLHQTIHLLYNLLPNMTSLTKSTISPKCGLHRTFARAKHNDRGGGSLLRTPCPIPNWTDICYYCCDQPFSKYATFEHPSVLFYCDQTSCQSQIPSVKECRAPWSFPSFIRPLSVIKIRSQQHFDVECQLQYLHYFNGVIFCQLLTIDYGQIPLI